MGGAVSSGQDNDELIDNLKEAEYIKSPHVERVFRIVDRAHYYLAECRESAYKDLAWKSGTLHLSAPCIYSEVMEALELKPGMSFLNLGSGTGYLNTMVGLVIGPYGVNHGIELHEDNVKYAYEKLESFMQTSKKFDDLEFCEPQFIVGNCLNLAPENRMYDRVYCGASCPVELKEAIQNMVKIKGILVVPVGDQLLKIKRASETEFISDNVLPVSFASLILPSVKQNNVDPIVLPEVNPLSLQCICRVTIRSAIRDTFDFNLAAVQQDSKPKGIRSTTKFIRHEGGRYPLNILPTAQGLMIMGAFNHTDDYEEDEDDRDRDEENGDASEPSDDEYLDRQLRQHASELLRARERSIRNDTKKNMEDVDSDMSDEEDDEGVSSDEPQSKDVNGNKSLCVMGSSELKDSSEYMESEDGTTADDEDDEKDGKERNKCNSSSKTKDSEAEMNTNGFRKAKTSRGESNGVDSASAAASTNPYEKIADRILTIMSPKRPENSSSGETVSRKKLPYERDASLSSDDEVMVPEFSSRSSAIQVTHTSDSSSQQCGIKTSYSTSADTSETSGFGSLGDDALHACSQYSGLGSLDENDFVSDGDFMPALAASVSNGKQHRFSKSPVGDISAVNYSTANDRNDSADAGWMDIEEDCEDSDEHDTSGESLEKHKKTHAVKVSDVDDHDDEDCDEEEKHSPRGPDFTSYLKEKVQTLPLPSTLKAFILYYR